jgi:WD40-like Beta Propeller Repeat
MSILTRPRPPRADVPADAGALEALIEEARRRARRRRRGYAAAALVAAAAGLLGFYGFNGGGATRAQDRPDPLPLPQATGVFAQVRGWIAYTDRFQDEPGFGIFAVDPTRPEADLSDRIQLLYSPGTPLDWSDDGTKLLILGFDAKETAPGDREKPRLEWRLFLLNADGTETTVLREGEQPGHLISASLSPDGSQVVYALFGPGYVGPSSESGDLRYSGIYVVETDGGGQHLLKKFGRRQWYADGPTETALWQPTFSPDGRTIAYFDGMGDWGNGLRVMNADGSNVRVLLDSDGRLSDRIGSHFLAWSPDGSLLAFQTDPVGIWVIGADGSGLKKLIPGGVEPSWSPGWLAHRVRGGSIGTAPGRGRRRWQRSDIHLRSLRSLEPPRTG